MPEPAEEIGSPYSVLPPEDVNKAVCEHHGEMTRYDLHLKRDGDVWHVRDPYQLFVCPPCLAGLAQQWTDEGEGGEEYDAKEALLAFVVQGWTEADLGTVEILGETQFDSGLRQLFERCPGDCGQEFESQAGLLREA